MTHPIHHIHKRKRIYQKHEQYPHPDKLKRVMDRVIYVAAVAGPVMTIPQVWNIWIKKNSAGVSLISWSSYLIIACVWLFYGIVHKEKPIIFTNILWIVLEVFIVAGILIY